jgi:hypothetical protein
VIWYLAGNIPCPSNEVRNIIHGEDISLSAGRKQNKRMGHLKKKMEIKQKEMFIPSSSELSTSLSQI